MEKIRLKEYAAQSVDRYRSMQAIFPEALLHQAYICKFSCNEYIVRFDEDIRCLFLLLDGRAKIYLVHENGKRALIQFLGKNDFIGELSLIEAEEHSKDVVAINDYTCLAIPLASAKKQLLEDNAFLLHLSKYLGDKLLKRTEHYTAMQDYELKNRLAKYILQIENNGYFQEKLTETAEYVRVSYRHLLYTLNKFREEGLLEKRGRQYFIVSKEALEKLSLKTN